LFAFWLLTDCFTLRAIVFICFIQCFVSPTVIAELKRIVEDSEVRGCAHGQPTIGVGSGLLDCDADMHSTALLDFLAPALILCGSEQKSERARTASSLNHMVCRARAMQVTKEDDNLWPMPDKVGHQVSPACLFFCSCCCIVFLGFG
jgi:hypothetical protein